MIARGWGFRFPLVSDRMNKDGGDACVGLGVYGSPDDSLLSFRILLKGMARRTTSGHDT
jgi:hypothetical protein